MPILTKTTQWTMELETARALYDNGDYEDVLRIADPIILRDDADQITRFGACQLKACVQSQRDEWRESLETLKLSAPLVDDLRPELRARFFAQRALAHRNLGNVNNALVDYEAARDAALAAGDEQTLAGISNNIAKVLGDANRIDEAISEVDAAIKIATRLRDDLNLGRYYDNKAQILNSQQRFNEALSYSKKAIALLANHPAGIEARTTHGLAMVGAGSGYLEKPTTLEGFRARRDVAKLVQVALDSELIGLALKRSGGHVLKAAGLLDISHSALIKHIAKFKLDRVPKRHRSKNGQQNKSVNYHSKML